ncbi:MAG: type IV pilus assembly protein PilM [Deltaproteobacteria bacterium]|nr:type IV pilus assembly protein PilM [Deltaproteobacteria bacterium]
MAKSKLSVGLDIGTSTIKLCQLKENKGHYALQTFGMIALPPEAIVDGALMNSTAIVDAIRELFQSQNVKNKEVAISISGHSVILKKIPLPVMTPEELEESIQWEAEQYIPFDINDVNIDVHILNPNTDQGQMDVLLVAAKKDMINDYVSVVTEAGLDPVCMDVDALALQNQFELNYDLPVGETVCLIDIGAAVININVIANRISAFTRDIAMGGNQFTEEIQKQLNVSYDEAEELKIGGHGTEDADSVVPQEVARIIQEVSDTLANEVQRSLDFYSATSADSKISRIYLSGGVSKVQTVARTIEGRTGIAVEVVDPFRAIDCNGRGLDPAFLKNVGPAAAIAIGLALRAAGDNIRL